MYIIEYPSNGVMGCDHVMLTVYMIILPLANAGGGGFQVILMESGVSAVTVMSVGAPEGTPSVTSVGAPEGTPSGVNGVTFASSPESSALAAENVLIQMSSSLRRY